jgi:hypothetical protein
MIPVRQNEVAEKWNRQPFSPRGAAENVQFAEAKQVKSLFSAA